MKRLKDNISGATRRSLHEASQLPRRHIAAIGAILLFLAVVAPFTPSGNVSANRAEELPLPAINQSTVNGEQPSATQSNNEEAATLPVTPEKPIEEITWAFYQVRPGDNLSKLMLRAGFTDRDAYIAGKTPGGSLTQLYPGQTLGFATQPNGELAEIRHKLSALESVVYRASGGKFEIERELKEPEVRVVEKSGEITSSPVSCRATCRSIR